MLAAKEAEAKTKRMAEWQHELELARTGDVQRPVGAVEAAGGAARNADAAAAATPRHIGTAHDENMHEQVQDDVLQTGQDRPDDRPLRVQLAHGAVGSTTTS